jgi:flagellar P-ring protein precursor FlgI
MKPVILIILLLSAVVSLPAELATRLKDIAVIEGVRENQLIGYGVVVGLEGTGDTTQNKFTFQAMANLLERMGLTLDPAAFQMRNTAAVAVTANLPPFSKVGTRIDITVSSLGSAKSLQGGMLLITPLMGGDGDIYAVAQGPVSIGGFNAGSGGAGVSKNHSTVGRIPSGALVEKEVDFKFLDLKSLNLVLNEGDFTTANRTVEIINSTFGAIASAQDYRTIRVNIPDDYRENPIRLVATLENLSVEPDQTARVVINERTGTIVFGEQVKISTIALAHGSITVTISSQTTVSQPAPLSLGQTVVTEEQKTDVAEENAHFTLFGPSTSISDVVKTLNALGATPRDIIAILQSMQAAGALQAELRII